MGWYDDGGFIIKRVPTTTGTSLFRVTFYGTDTAGMHRYAAHVTKTDLLGMRREINKALKTDQEDRR